MFKRRFATWAALAVAVAGCATSQPVPPVQTVAAEPPQAWAPERALEQLMPSAVGRAAVVINVERGAPPAGPGMERRLAQALEQRLAAAGVIDARSPWMYLVEVQVFKSGEPGRASASVRSSCTTVVPVKGKGLVALSSWALEYFGSSVDGEVFGQTLEDHVEAFLAELRRR